MKTETEEYTVDREMDWKAIRKSAEIAFAPKVAAAAEALKAPGLAELIAKVKAENEAAKKKARS